MERDSMVFYRSFYEAIKGLPRDIQLEIYTALMEYGFNGVLPDNLKPVAKGMVALMKPVIDSNNVRFNNGKKGGRKSGTHKKSPVNPDYSLTFEQEADQMLGDTEWRDSICRDFGIDSKEYADRIRIFLAHCNKPEQKSRKPRHESIEDAQSHLRYWMTKAYAEEKQTKPRKITRTARRAPDPDEKRELEEKDRREKEYNRMRERFRQRVPDAFTTAAPMTITQYNLIGYDSLSDSVLAADIAAIKAGELVLPTRIEDMKHFKDPKP